MNIGTVISDGKGYQIVTKIVNGLVAETEPIENFITKNVVIEHKGERKTIQDIINMYCDEYMDKNKVIMSEGLKKLLD